MVRYATALALLFAASLPARAGEGRIEINQASVLAKGGFPFVLDQAGSYVLTGNLDVPAGTTGIRITADDVSLDLNGFAIRGPYVCSQVSCPAPTGSSRGIDAQAEGASVAHGVVTGFEAECVLVAGGRVEALRISRCGAGCLVAHEALLLGNRVVFCGAAGLALTDAGSYAQNSVTAANLRSGSDPVDTAAGVSGGGNSCNGSPCPYERRRYYLTLQTFPGNHRATGVCVPRFHMASLHELRETTGFQYDTQLGATLPDSGSGPPIGTGWMRSGAGADASGPAGSSNCAQLGVPWASALATDVGSAAGLTDNWNDTPAYRSGGMWESSAVSCDQSLPVWCIQD